MIAPRRLSELIHTIYAAAEDPSLWDRVLDQVAEELDSGMTVLIAVGGGETHVSTAIRADPEAIRLYNEHWGADDPWLKSGHESLTREGAVAFSEQLVDDRSLVTTEFYNDFMRSFDMFHALTATIVAQRDMTAGLSCHFSRGRFKHRRCDFELLELVTPHLAQALRFQARRAEQQTLDEASSMALDRAVAGFVLVDGKGRIVDHNIAAQAILRRGDALASVAGRIVARPPGADAQLRSLLASAAATAVAQGTDAGGSLILARGQGRLPYVVTALPVSGMSRDFTRRGAAVALLIADLEARSTIDAETVQRTFGWTPAESRVALQVASGSSAREIAARHGVSVETVRSQIKRVLAKAGVRSQTELVRVLANLTTVALPE